MNATFTDQLVDNHRYKVLRFIAKGCAGSVYEVQRCEDGKHLALKQCFAEDIEHASLKQALREASILKLIRIPGMDQSDGWFPWLVSMDDFWIEEKNDVDLQIYGGIYVNVVMELIDGPSLDNYIEKLTNPRMKVRHTGGFRRIRPGEELSESDEEVVDIKTDRLYSWIAQIALALRTIHKLRIIHRDVKPGNLVLSSDLERIRLVDFSIARVLGPDDVHLNTVCGTANYAAIEVLQGLPYTESCDMWSLGCVLYELLTMQKLFKSSQAMKILQTVNKSFHPEIPDDCDGGLSMICYRLLNVDPNARPTALQLCRHPRLRSVVTKELMLIQDPYRRNAIANFLDLGDFVSDGQASRQTAMIREIPIDGYTLIDEDTNHGLDPIDEFYDDDIQCPVLPLLQGDWILSGTNPEVSANINGRRVTFSDKRTDMIVSRAYQSTSPSVIEWMLGTDAILMKSKSVFVNPQKIFFGHVGRRTRMRRGSDAMEPLFVLVREQPVASEFSTASSTLH